MERTTYRYADGSIAVSEIEIPTVIKADQVVPMKISGCVLYYRKADVKKWNNCTVSWDAVTWSMHYTAAYQIYQFGSSIDSVTGLRHGGVGSFSNGTLEIITKNGQCRSCPSSAQGKVTQSGGGVVTRTVGVRLDVRADWGGGRSSSFGD